VIQTIDEDGFQKYKQGISYQPPNWYLFVNHSLIVPEIPSKKHS
jgi:hypothetical protein